MVMEERVDQQQGPAFGAVSDSLGELPHAFHHPGFLRSVSPNWSITTLRSADNIPSIPKLTLSMDAEDSPWGGVWSRDPRVARNRANAVLIRRAFKVKLQCQSCWDSCRIRRYASLYLPQTENCQIYHIMEQLLRSFYRQQTKISPKPNRCRSYPTVTTRSTHTAKSRSSDNKARGSR